jgi:hypothetical protein
MFIAGFIIDVFYALYTMAVTDRVPFAAAVYSVVIGLVGMTAMVSAVEDSAYILPYLLGLGCGTYVVVAWGDVGGEP